MNINKIIGHWYSFIYDQFETDVDDVNFLIKTIGNEPKSILEVCCGTGRILAALAAENHDVVGFDFDEEMLSRIEEKIKNFNNIKYSQQDALKNEWGNDYDVCVLAGNILINIEGDLDYQEAQKLFIRKAYDCLKDGGYLYLDFNMFLNPDCVYNNNKERIIFKGTDDHGVFGTYSILNSSYDPKKQMLFGYNKTELKLENEFLIKIEKRYEKHIPTLAQVKDWLQECNFSIEQIYGSYQGEKIGNNTSKAIIYAKKHVI